jgi:hypothetical protein
MAPTKLMFCTVLGDSQRWVVAVDWPDGTIEQVGEFQRQSEAADWITNQSEAWLQERGSLQSLCGPRAPQLRI